MDRHIINQDTPLLDALARLNALSGEVMTLLAVNDDGEMTGTLTDGDIRRNLLKGVSLESPVSAAMHRDFCWLEAGNVDIAGLRSIRERGIRLIPLLDIRRRIVRILDTDVTRTLLPVSAVLMAGGKGERLRPLTLDRPKPLLKVGGKPIIDYNIEALAAVGIDDVTVTTNYLADMIHEHFSTPVSGITVKCVREPAPLGTIGSLGLVPHCKGGVTLLMNSDLLTTVSFEDMYLKHMSENADITIAAIPYNISVPYAILKTDGTEVKEMEEKPTYSYYANAGIYMINNSLLEGFDGTERMDAPDFIESALANGRKVVYFPINGTWIDIGNPSDFRHACELMRHHHDLSI